jgi:hypothetical protein
MDVVFKAVILEFTCYMTFMIVKDKDEMLALF